MNLSAIKSLCHSGRRATIYDSLHGGQWISNGRGAWLVEDLHIEDDAALMSLWNLSEKARNKAVFLFERAEDPRFTYMGYDGEETLEEVGQIAMGDEGRYICLNSGVGGLLFIEAELLKPVRGDYRQYRARWDHGRPIVAIYEDLTLCVALILPVGDVLAEELRQTAARMVAPVYHWPDEMAEAEDAAAKAEEAAEALLNDDAGEADDEPGGA